MLNILIYGTGKGAERFYKKISFKYNVVGFVITSNEGSESVFLDKPLISVTNISSVKFDELFIANEFADTYFSSIAQGVVKSKIKIVYFKCYFDVLERILQIESPSFDPSLQPCHPIITKGLFYQTRFDIQPDYSSQRDYVRFKLLELLAEQIHDSGVTGSVAELGVYQGNFAKYINAVFPKRKLYLFDTFEGFDATDEKFDVEHGYADQATFNHLDRFKNTSVELVLAKMAHPKSCIVCKGFFPETAANVDDEFALVSLDADLYQPMFAGLEYFYPRLSKGGFLLLHEYNHPKFLGVKRAVADFEQKYGALAKVPMPDTNGTLVITKI
jgi:hypothetical protein